MYRAFANFLLASTLYAVGPDTAFDIQSGRFSHIERVGPGATYALPLDSMKPHYVVPMPESGGPSIYIDPFTGESD